LAGTVRIACDWLWLVGTGWDWLERVGLAMTGWDRLTGYGCVGMARVA
jgi:hypothetical protein